MKNFKKSKEPRRSAAAFQTACELFPGGVNSPVRSWKSVGGQPFFVAKGNGSELLDVDGNRYIDFIGSWGAMILGHCHSKVVAAVRKQAKRGFSFGTPTELESQLATQVRKAYPSLERMRFVSSGTEACMHVLRVARGFTSREKIIKFEGCYHGASDSMLVKVGSGVATFGLPDSAGVTVGAAADTLIAPYNDLAAVKTLLDAHKNQIAAIILEPVVGNAGVLLPKDGFLTGLAAAAKSAGALLIFDEVMTGFRLSRGGAQMFYGITPDLTTLGKIVGGGLPCAVYGGRKEIMEKVAPQGPVYQAGTLSGNPLAMVAGIETLRQLAEEGVYEGLEMTSAAIAAALLSAAEETGWSNRVCLNRAGSMFTLFFCPGPVTNFKEAMQSDVALFAKFFHAMRSRGVCLPPSQFEAAFVNLAMNRKIVKRVTQAARAAFAELSVS
ncbi:MAG: glutamate-1-semialdehyde 2,1-aminomutase [Planctomycetota bacterium]